jgi:hypothetical protein
MGQYFAAVNKDKHEFVCPWCINGGAKLWEWAANSQGAIFTLLLRQSDEGGGGDWKGEDSIGSRWAGDRVALVGDYDSSKLWDECYEHRSYRNISKEVVEAWNEFIELPEKKLHYRPCMGCTTDMKNRTFSTQPV